MPYIIEDVADRDRILPKLTERQIAIRSVFICAVTKFNDVEEYIVTNDLSERCICARLSLHLTEALKGTDFCDYCVDVEYNRGYDGLERGIKRIDNSPITVDLIVHKRGYDCSYGFDNLICVEMKKSTNRKGCNSDETRLSKMVSYDHGYCYQTGFMMLIDMKENKLKIKKEYYLEYYK